MIGDGFPRRASADLSIFLTQPGFYPEIKTGCDKLAPSRDGEPSSSSPRHKTRGLALFSLMLSCLSGLLCKFNACDENYTPKKQQVLACCFLSDVEIFLG